MIYYNQLAGCNGPPKIKDKYFSFFSQQFIFYFWTTGFVVRMMKQMCNWQLDFSVFLPNMFFSLNIPE